MNEIKIFNSPQFGEIRTAGNAEQPLFCLADVCRAIGIKNNRNVAKRLDEGDVHLVDTPTTNQHGAIVNQQVMFVTEGGFYQVVMRSDNESTKPFRKWVTSEVLPSIRKSGGYIMAREDESDEDILARALVVAQNTLKRRDERIKALENRSAEQQKQIAFIKAENETLKAKQTYLDVILLSKNTVSVTQIGQDYGMSAKALNGLLRTYGIQHKVHGQWILYAKYLSQGYVHSKPVDIIRSNGMKEVKLNTEWTQKGRVFLYEELKKHNILPLIEK